MLKVAADVEKQRMAVPHEVMFQNQLQFNMNVPLTVHNMATHFHHPRPITIERTAAMPSCQGFPMAQLANRLSSNPTGGQAGQNGSAAASNGFNFSALSQDRMAVAVQMAQRDIKNQKLQQKSQELSQDKGRQRSPSPDSGRAGRSIPGAKYWASSRSRVLKKAHGGVAAKGSKAGATKAKGSRMDVREHDRNRAPRQTGSQTPPTSPPRQAFLNTRAVTEKERSDSPPTRDTPSLTRVSRVPTDDIEKLQLEMELCLQQIESVQKRALSEHNTDFLRRGQPRPCREPSFLEEEEGEERRQVRANEHSHRALRTIYNLQQQVREIERQMAQLPHDSRATKKSQAYLRLTMVNKGAVKLLQAFITQLPQQDLHSGLPSHFSELADLVRQVTLLSAGSSPDGPAKVNGGKKLSPVGNDLIAMVDQVEKLNKHWQQQAEARNTPAVPTNQKPPFVTNFKNTNSAFTKEQVGRPQLSNTHFQDLWHAERKAALQAGIQALLNAQRKKEPPELKLNTRPYTTQLAVPQQNRPKGLGRKIPTRKPPPTRKGFLLPYKVRQQRSQHPSLFDTHFADPTITANLKASTLLRNPITKPRPKSEPPSPRDKKKVNFAVRTPAALQYHASYPGARSRGGHPSASPQPRRSRSHSPHSPRLQRQSPRRRDRSPSSYCLSDSESSGGPYLFSEDELSTSPVSGFSSSSPTPRRHRSSSPVGRSGSPSQSAGRSLRNPPAQRRHFYLADADPELVEELFPKDKKPVKSGPDSRATNSLHSQRDADSLSPYLRKVERRVQKKLAPLLTNHHAADETQSDQEDFDRVANGIMDEAVNEVTREYLAMEQEDAAVERAAAHIDNPTLENILQALERMEKENDLIRRKYPNVTFHDSARSHRYQTASQVFAEFRSEQPRNPPAFEVTNTRPPPQDTLGMPRVFAEELSEEPLIFTKDSKAYQSHVKFQEHGEGDVDSASRPVIPPPAAQRRAPLAVRPKTLLSMKQTVVERITDAAERFEYYQRGLKQHLGKKNPFELYERLADNILKLCCSEVARELEHINTDMAENIYTSEFMDENGLPLVPPDLANDFETEGTAAQNLIDSAAAQRTVEAAVSRAVGSLMLPSEEPEVSIVSPKRLVDSVGDHSPPWDTSLKHVFDATALYEASVTEKAPAADTSQARSAKGAAKEDDTQLEGEEDYDYEDDYTDISDADEEDEEYNSESPSP